MDIGVLVPSFPAVTETFLHDQLSALVERGHKVTIYPDREPAGDTVAAQEVQARVRVPPRVPARLGARAVGALGLLVTRGWRRPRATLAGLNFLSVDPSVRSLRFLYHQAHLPARRHDVLHAHFGPSGVRAQRLRRLGILRGPLVTTFHGSDLNVLARRLGPRYYRALLRDGDRFTVSSRFLAGRLEQVGAAPERIERIPLGVPRELFPFRARDPGPGGEVNLLTVGRLEEVKGIKYGLRAVASLQERVAALRYRIVGEGPLREQLEELARRLGVAERVEFSGALSREALREAYASAHIYLQPSVVAADGGEEGQGYALLEAQCSGLPAIATTTGGLPEGLRDGETGYLVPPRDPAAIAARLRELIEHPELWPRMGEAGHRFVARQFDLERIMDRLERVYRALAAGKEG